MEELIKMLVLGVGALLFGGGVAATVYVIYKTVKYLSLFVAGNLLKEAVKELKDKNQITGMEGFIEGVIQSKEGHITKVSLKKNDVEIGQVCIEAEQTSSDIYVGKRIELYN